MTYADVDLNAVNVFKPMGYSPIPTDIRLVGLDDNSIDEFDTPDQSPVYDTDDLHPCNLAYDNSPCDVADPYDWNDDSIDDI